MNEPEMPICSGDPAPGLPYERCVAIARRVLRPGCTEQQVMEMADDIGRFVAEFPPPTQEQLDKIAVLLRPELSIMEE